MVKSVLTRKGHEPSVIDREVMFIIQLWLNSVIIDFQYLILTYLKRNGISSHKHIHSNVIHDQKHW